ncbi:hypothetical protein JTB14_016410 [Gonioctena quinquepunctata]|nr:hypothetical protein JTB14_016410 [Gonioctena quinquepunctata]
MASWGIPKTLRSDNRLGFYSHSFKEFANKYGFKHTTSSSLYLKSNGQVEAAVKTAQKILLKSNNPNSGILSYSTSKLECGFFPSQLIMGKSPTCSGTNLIPTWTHIADYKWKREWKFENIP